MMWTVDTLTDDEVIAGLATDDLHRRVLERAESTLGRPVPSSTGLLA